MTQSFNKHVDYYAMLLLFAYGKNLLSTGERKQELLQILISCYNFQEKSRSLRYWEKMELLSYLVDTSTNCQNYPKVIEYAKKLLTLPIPLQIKTRLYNTLGIAYSAIGQYSKAVEYLEKHLIISIKLGDKKGEGSSYHNLGATYTSSRQYSKALECIKKHLNISIELSDKAGEGNAYGNLGDTYYRMMQYSKAQEYHKKELNISIGLGDKNGEEHAYSGLGNVHNDIGQYSNAREYHEKALKLSIELGDKRKEGMAYCNLGITCDHIGQYRKAIECHEKHLNISIEQGDKPGEGRAYINLGNVYYSFERYSKALEYHEKGLNISIELGDKVGEGMAYDSLGLSYVRIGLHSKGLEYHKKYLNISIGAKDKAGEAAAYANLGVTYTCIGQYRKAIECHQKHLNVAIELGDKLGEAKAYCHLGVAYCKIGQYSKAIECDEKHLNLSIELGHKAGEEMAYFNLGLVYFSIGQYDKTIEYSKKQLKISIELKDKSREGRAYNILGLVFYLLGQYDTAIKYLCQSVIVRDNFRRDFVHRDQFNISIANQDFQAHTMLMSCLLKLDHVKKALLVLDVGRAKALYDLMRLNFSTVNNGLLEDRSIKWIEEIPQMIYIPEKDTHTCITDNICRTIQNGSVVVFGFDAHGDLIIWVLTQQQTFIRKWSPTSGTARKFLESNVINVRNNLGLQRSKSCLEDKRDAMREKNSKMLNEMPDLKNKLPEKQAECGEFGENFDFQDEQLKYSKPQSGTGKPQRVRDNRTKPHVSPTITQIKADLQEAYEALIAPVKDVVTGVKLVIVPEGPLFLLPFSALVESDGNYLCDRYSVQITSALHTLNFRLNIPVKQLGAVLAIGNPTVVKAYFGDRLVDLPLYLEQLPGAENEAAVCASYFDGQPLLKQCATKENVLKQMKDASIIHIAAHGNMDYAEIFLAPNAGAPSPPTEEYYLLRPEDISRCSLSARLVVLSCCHSGRGQISAEGVVGTARSFLGVGARAVLVALWELPDKETLEFMKLFYQNVCDRLSVCVALQQAMKTFKKTNDAIKAWAPFQIFGEDVVFTNEELETICHESRQSGQIQKGS